MKSAEGMLGRLSPADREEMMKMFKRMMSGFEHVVKKTPKGSQSKEDIEIKLSMAKPKPTEGPDIKGIMIWDLSIPAGKTSNITFTYTIKRPENWRLYSR